MQELTTEAYAYYVAAWAISFLAAFFRAIRDGDYRSYCHGLSLGATSGFFSFGVVAVLRDYSPGDGGGHWYYLGIAALIGLLAKEQDKIAKTLLSNVGRMFFQGLNNRRDRDEFGDEDSNETTSTTTEFDTPPKIPNTARKEDSKG